MGNNGLTMITGYFLASGPRFSPTAVEASTHVKFTRKNEPGETANTGRYRGKPLPYGSGDIVDDQSGMALLDARSPLVAQAAAVIDECRAHGATSLQMHLDVQYSGQCNLEMRPRLLLALAGMQVEFTISCFET
jgi:hypothetical protein